MGEHERVTGPSVPVIGLPGGPIETAVADLSTDEARAEIGAFYEATLAPELVCQTGEDVTVVPQTSWLAAPGRTVITARVDGRLVGTWCVRNNAILYPCIELARVVPVIKALWRETTQHFDYLWAETPNPAIMKFAAAAKAKGSVTQIGEHRMEWRRPT